MNEDLVFLKTGIQRALDYLPKTVSAQADLRRAVFGKEGLLTAFCRSLGSLPAHIRAERGQALNQFTHEVRELFVGEGSSFSAHDAT